MNRLSFLLFLACLGLQACRSDTTPDELMQGLKPGQARVLINIDGQRFYKEESVFGGTIEATERRFKMNLFDQFESNIIVAFSGENWYANHPVRRSIYTDNQLAASVMIGRMSDPVQRMGEGYLMTEGELSLDSFSSDRIVLRFAGKAGKYEFQRVPEKWNTVRGLIVYKKPPVQLQGISKQKAYF